MASLIPQPFIDDLIERCDLVRVIDSVVPLKRMGKNYGACCPFHDERTPSFTVSPDKQFYYCFGCGASGNVIGFTMEYHRVSFVEAIEQLAQMQGMPIPREDNGRDDAEHKLKPIYKAMEDARQYYHDTLQTASGRDAMLYLKRRGLDEQTIAQFQLGYAPKGWDHLLKHLKSCGHSEPTLIEAGLCSSNRSGGLYDRFRDRVMFPIRDNRGRTIAFGGRVMGDEKPKYLNSPETPVFQKSASLYGWHEAKQAEQRSDNVLIVEGYMDVIALAQAGLHHCMATLGTATSTAHCDRLLRQYQSVTYCFDGDEAGRKAAWRGMEASLQQLRDGKSVSFLFLPEGEDPDSLVKQEGPDHFEQRIKQAKPISDYFYDTLKQQCDVATIEGRAKLSKVAKPYIEKIKDGVLKELFLSELANITQLSLDQLDRAWQPTQQAPQIADSRPAAAPTQRRPRKANNAAPRQVRPLVDHIIQIALRQPAAINEAELDEELFMLDAPRVSLLRELIMLYREKPDISTAAVLGHWYGTENGEVLAELAAEQFILGSDSDSTLADALKHAHERYIEQELDKQLQSPTPDKPAIRRLLQKKAELAKKKA